MKAVTTLTERAFLNARDAPEHLKKCKVYLQYLGQLEECKATLSDGEFFEHLLVAKSQRGLFSQSRPNDILECVVQFHKGHFFLLQYSPVYTGVLEKIGNPIALSRFESASYIKSRKATTEIPSEIWRQVGKQGGSGEVIHASSARGYSLESTDFFTSIRQLTLASKAWVIKARVAHKSKVFEYPRGKMFKCVLFDSSGLIELAFYDAHCTSTFDKIREDSVLILTGGDVKTASKYNTTGNPVEIHFTNRSDLCESLVNNDRVPLHPPVISYISGLTSSDVRTTDYVSVLGIVLSVGDTQDISTKNGVQKMRVVTLCDEGLNSVDINLWGEIHGMEHVKKHEICCFDFLKKSVFKDGMNLSSSFMTKIHWEGFDLTAKLFMLKKIQSEMHQDKFTQEITSIGGKVGPRKDYKTIQEIKSDAEMVLATSPGERKLFYKTVAAVTEFGKHLYYDGCATEGCLKKVQPLAGHVDRFACPVCGELPIGKQPIPRFMGQVQITDESGSDYVTYCCDFVGEALLSMTVGELKRLSQDEEGLHQCLSTRKMRYYQFDVTVRRETYQGQVRCRLYLVAAHSLEDLELSSKAVDSVKVRKLELITHFENLRKRVKSEGDITEGLDEEDNADPIIDSPQKVLNIAKEGLNEMNRENTRSDRVTIYPH